jgi:hypothetical protein
MLLLGWIIVGKLLADHGNHWREVAYGSGPYDTQAHSLDFTIRLTPEARPHSR